MLEGSCLCGDVRYRVNAEPRRFFHCHCQTCRKALGTAFSSTMPVPIDAFEWVAGEDQTRGYESSPGKIRTFCTKCSSELVALKADVKLALLRVGCIDTLITDKAVAHIWRSDGADWYDPTVAIPEKPEGPT